MQQAITHGLRERRLIGRGHEDEPLVEYALLAATFLTLTSAAIATAVRRRALPRPHPLGDTLLLGLATTRLSRLFTREKVTRPIRAPFTEVAPDAGRDEVKERPRGEGATRALGELLTCPRCVGMWASAVLSVAYLFAPAPTRAASGILAASLISDWINVRFAHAREKKGDARRRPAAAARTAWGIRA